MPEDTITITLSEKTSLAWIRNKVRSGEYSNGTEVIAESVAIVREQQEELECWLRTTIASRYERHQADPSSAMSLEQLHSDLEEHRKLRAASH